MANENEEKKKKKVLIPIIIACAVLLLGGVAAVLATTGVFKGKPAETSESESSGEEEQVLYSGSYFWNVERETYAGKSIIGTSGRTVDPSDGYYHILFASDGRQVTRRCADKRLVDQIDSNDLMGLEFDEKGIIIGVYPLTKITLGYEISGWYVQEVKEDGTIVFNTTKTMNGRFFEYQFPAGVRIFDVSGQDADRYVGEEINSKKFTEGDRVYSLINADGTVTQAFVTNRNVKPRIYWNVERKWNSELLSTTRTPNDAGEYEILMAVQGEQVTVKTKDRNIATLIDKQAAKNMALGFDSDGYVNKVTTGGTATGGGTFGSWAHVTTLDEDHIIAEKLIEANDKGKVHDGYLAKDVEVYDVSGSGEFVGVKVDDLRVYDQIHCLKNEAGQVSVVFIVARISEDPVYWNVTRKYDSAKAETTRTPEADGYYHFLMAVEGKQVELKTKDVLVASKVDSYAAKCMGLKLDGDIILNTYSAAATKGTGKGTAASWAEITKVYSATEFHTLKDPKSTSAKAGEQLDLKMASNCKVYNVSSNYINYVGEPTTIQLGDTVHCLTNMKGECGVIFVVTRPKNMPIYWNVNRKYDSTNKCSKRVPEADGYYHFTMATNGQQYELRTKDKEIADTIDASVNSCIALQVSGDIIVKAFNAGSTVAGAGGTAASWAEVTKIDSPTVFHTLKDPNSTAAKAGEKLTLTMVPGCQIYNVSSGSVQKFVGERAEIKLNDTVHCYLNKDKQVTYVFIVGRTIPKVQKLCPVCGKTVEWEPYKGVFSYDETAPKHFYFYQDRTPNGQMSTSKPGSIHLDLNGCCLNAAADNRAFSIGEKSDVTIMDLSDAKTSVIKGSNGLQTGNGAVLSAAYTTSKLTLLNLTVDASTVNAPSVTGVIYATTTTNLTLEGCTVKGGRVLTGSAIFARGNLTLKDTVITGAVSEKDGAVVLDTAASLTVSGKTSVKGGTLKDGTASNITFLGNGVVKTADGITAEDGSLGVRLTKPGVFTDKNFADYEKKFVSDIPEGILSVEADGALSLDYPVTGLKFTAETVSVPAGTPTEIKAGTTPVNRSDIKITYESSDPSVLVIDKSGNFIGVKASGTPVTVTAKTEDGKYTAEVQVTVTEAENTEHMHVEGTHQAIQTEDGVKISYKPWANTGKYPTESGYYYLTEDLHLTDKQAMLAANTDIHICLNGHTIDNIYDGGSQTISMFNEGASMTVCDCSDAETGTVKGKGPYAVPGITAWVRYGTLTIYGGTFIGGESTNAQGGGTLAVSKGASAYIYGGTFKDGVAPLGGNIANMGTLVIDGNVTVSGGKANAGRGGNIYCESGSVTMMNGVTVTGGSSTEVGGNIYAKGTSLTMTDTTVSNGKTTGSAKAGGNVSLCGGANVLKNCTLTGGLATNPTANDLHVNGAGETLLLEDTVISDGALFQTASRITLKGKTVIGSEGKYGISLANSTATYLQAVTADSLSSDAKIIIAASKAGKIVLGGAAYKDCFISMNPEQLLKEEGADLVLEAKPVTVKHAHCVCGGTITAENKPAALTHTCDGELEWTAWADDATLPCYADLTVGENYFYLTQDVCLTENWRPGYNGTTYAADMEGRNITVCLNGHSIYTKTKATILSTLGANSTHTKNVVITFTDCQETPGSVYMLPKDKDNGTSALMWLNSSGTKVSSYNVTFDGNGMKAKRSGGIFALTSGAELTLYSGKITGGTVYTTDSTARYGGLVHVPSGAKFTMYGGTLSGGKVLNEGTATPTLYGGCLSTLGTTAIYGGTIENGSSFQGGNIYATGTFTIDGKVTVKDGVATNGRGGNLWVDTSGVVNITGATFTGGSATVVGGSIYTKGKTFNMTDTTVSGGKMTASNASGGNMSVAGGTATLKNCVISKGEGTNPRGCDFHMNASSAVLVLEDTTIERTAQIIGAQSITLKGKVLIGGADYTGGIFLSNTGSNLKTLTLSGFDNANSCVYISASAGGTVVNTANPQDLEAFRTGSAAALSYNSGIVYSIK